MAQKRLSKRLHEREIVRRDQKKKQLDARNDTTVIVGSFNINQFPNEILVRIFQKLSPFHRFTLEFVCRRWNLLAKKSIWTDVKALHLSPWTPVKHKINALIERAGECVRELSLDEINWTKTGLLCRLLPEMPNLLHISLSGKGDVQLTDEQLEMIADCFPNLLSLNILKCLKFDPVSNGVSKQASHAALSSLLSKCDALEYLSLCRANNVGGTSPFQPTVLPPKLAFLETDDTFDLDTMFKVANEQCQNIRCLSLQFLKPTISSLDFVHTDTLQRLVHLEIDFHKAPTVSFFSNFIKSLHLLGNLRILRIDKITGEALSAVIDRCPNLADFGYSAYDTDILPAFAQLHRLTKLRYLIIRHRGKALQQICSQNDGSRQKDAPRGAATSGDETMSTVVGPPLEAIAQNGMLVFLSVNFTIPIRLMCNLVQQCKCLSHLYCPIGRYPPLLEALGRCMTNLNEASSTIGTGTTTIGATTAVHRRRRTLNISVNFQSRVLSHPYIRFLYSPDLGSVVVKHTFGQLFTNVPNFLYDQSEVADGTEEFEETDW